MKAAIFTLNNGLYKAKVDSPVGAVLRRTLEQAGLEVRATAVLPQDKDVAASVFARLADSGAVNLILTAGAVSYTESDCAPDAVAEVADRMLPGIPEALRAYNLRYSKKVILDRSAAGIRKGTLLLNLPESTKTAKENLEYILPELVQAVEALSFLTVDEDNGR